VEVLDGRVPLFKRTANVVRPLHRREYAGQASTSSYRTIDMNGSIVTAPSETAGLRFIASAFRNGLVKARFKLGDAVLRFDQCVGCLLVKPHQRFPQFLILFRKALTSRNHHFLLFNLGKPQFDHPLFLCALVLDK
jgi:hypothetical protein